MQLGSHTHFPIAGVACPGGCPHRFQRTGGFNRTRSGRERLSTFDKVIPGLQRSGDRIGDGQQEGGSTPVAQKAGRLWKSEVSLRDARDYACDGCYEPQLSAADAPK